MGMKRLLLVEKTKRRVNAEKLVSHQFQVLEPKVKNSDFSKEDLETPSNDKATQSQCWVRNFEDLIRKADLQSIW
jgi:hypothetical protein